jgi:tetratricopeptide (TPR) repeat protein
MDLQDFEAEDLYFNATLDPEITALLEEAASLYPEPETEALLLRAYFLDPRDLNVLVALYRYFYYQHRLPDALKVAHKAIAASGERLHLPDDWRHLTRLHLGQGVLVSMTLTRFYLMAHKGAGYLEMRLGDLADAVGRLQTLVNIDSNDRLGVKALLALA